MAVEVCWIFSLPRSGSSVTAYAAAAPWGHRVADEVLGPWDRTTTPYNYPPLQRELVRAYHAAGCVLTPEVIQIALDLFEILGQRTGTVVFKHPHRGTSPEAFRAAFPDHKAVYVVRNPIKRLNSLYTRGWVDALRQGYEVEHFKDFLRDWRREPGSVVFEHLRSNPRRYFADIYRAWGWDASEEELERAVAYSKGTYHGKSGQTGAYDADPEAKAGADKPISESRWSLPEEALTAYLEDDEIVAFLREQGWPTRADGYRPAASALGRARQRLRRFIAPKVAPQPVVEPGRPIEVIPERTRSTTKARVCFLISLHGSGEEGIAAAAAARADAPLLSRPLGPWNEPGSGWSDLTRRIAAQGRRLTPETVARADRLFEEAAGPGSIVIATVAPEDVDIRQLLEVYAHSPAGHLLCNPAARLREIAARGWWGSLAMDYDLRRFKEFAFIWSRASNPLVLDSFEREPRDAQDRLLSAWGIDAPPTPDIGPERAEPETPQPIDLPRAVAAYAADFEVQRLAQQLGWTLDPANDLQPR